MDLFEGSRRSLLPSFLCSPSAPSPPSTTPAVDRVLGRTLASPAEAGYGPSPISVVAQAPIEPGKSEMCLRVLSAACTAGGIAAYGLTHMAVTR
ncbi:hypothetical protein C4D60_Mb09t23410 [Musa balbisiana]|uniref:Uncharacterized protein n=1 Tax=Musa balbisiana TaxID=52838 RepID=A0A4S8IJ92_MUSBA|nr:hypothetical protein C4D60_Mb09t23410 [Musa balbisiana]